MNATNPGITGQSLKTTVYSIGRTNLFLWFNLFIVVGCGIIFSKQVIAGSIILESVILLVTLGWIGLQNMGYRETLRLKKTGIKEIGLTLIIIASGIHAASFIDQLFRFFLQNFGAIPELNLPQPQNIPQFMLSLAAVAVLPALAEELLFRGLLLKSYEKLLSTGKAVFISSLFFAMAHLSISNFWGPFILGLLCGWLVCIFDSIYLGIIGHLLNNGLTMTLFYLAPELWNEKSVTVKDLAIEFPSFIVAGFILIILILRYKPRLKTNCEEHGKLLLILKHWSTWPLFIVFAVFAIIELLMIRG